MSYKLIADHCYISLDTVSGHIKTFTKSFKYIPNQKQ